MCVYIYIYVYMNMYICMYIHTYTHTHAHIIMVQMGAERGSTLHRRDAVLTVYILHVFIEP